MWHVDKLQQKHGNTESVTSRSQKSDKKRNNRVDLKYWAFHVEAVELFAQEMT